MQHLGGLVTCELLFLLSVLFCNVHADETNAPATLFSDSEVLELSIEAPFSRLLRNRRDEPQLQARLKYYASNGVEIILKTEIKPRGISRLRHCSFPPLHLIFKTDDLVGTVFEGQEKLKLVTHCKRTASYRNYVAREYQVYRAYNLVTDYSFRVRWVNIQYIDTESTRKAFTESGFLIEEDWAVASRLGMETLDVDSLEVAQLDRTQTSRMVLFQYLIGNIDWSALRGPVGSTCCHNFKILTPPGETTGRVLLPYDFDQSGFVAARYAVHNASHGLRPRDRLYKGYCVMNDDIHAAITHFGQRRNEWLQLLDAEPVSKNARRHGVRFIDRGFKLINEPRYVARRMITRCRE